MSEFDYIKGEGWRPKEGDVIEGKIIDISRGYSTEQDEFYPIVTVEKGDKSATAIHCFHTVLKEWVLQTKPQLGATIGIKFLGKKKKKNNVKQEVADYICRIQEGSKTGDPYAGMGPAGVAVAQSADDEPAA